MGILISWLLLEPADLDIHCLQEKPADQDLHCLQEKPADQDLYCLQELITDFILFFKRVNCLSTERYKANGLQEIEKLPFLTKFKAFGDRFLRIRYQYR